MTDAQAAGDEGNISKPNGACDKPAPAAAAPKPPQVKLTKSLAMAIQRGIEEINTAMAELSAAQAAESAARRKLQSLGNVNQQFIIAIVTDAGLKPEQFARFGLWQEGEDVYLRSNIE